MGDIMLNNNILRWARKRYIFTPTIPRIYARMTYIALLMAIACVIGTCSLVHADTVYTFYGYTVSQYADAIYKTEGGSHTRHPYGVLTTYKHASPRQACINTVLHQYRLWARYGAHGDFLSYLAMSYAPIGAGNDPTGLNKNWVKNVKWFLEHPERG